MAGQPFAAQPAFQHALSQIGRRLASSSRPFLIAIDGASGAGKTTLASALAASLDAVLIPSDDFYAAHIPDVQWNQFTPEQRYLHVLDWRRLRQAALEPLRAGQPARWQPFDFDHPRPDGTYPLRSAFTERAAKSVILLEGAYSARPDLADLIDFSILVDVPQAVRHARLAQREAAAFLRAWHERWDAVERYYFTQVRPPSAFDLVLSGSVLGEPGEETG